MSPGRVLYRLRQTANAVGSGPGREERQLVARFLSPAEQRLFYEMNRLGQRHGLNVCRALLAEGCQERNLLKVALLHDVAKGRVSLWQRGINVILETWAPGLLERWAQGNAPGWRRSLGIIVHHAQQGAELVAAAGASPRVVSLIRLHHASDVNDPALQLFQAADGRN